MWFVPRPPDARTRPRDLLDVTLDAHQRAAATRPPGGAMLVLGEAGYGKTTVALARLAHLYAAAKKRFRAIALVPNEGLAQLLQRTIVRLGADVAVQTYGRFARRVARRTFGDLPRRESVAASVGVAKIKRDPALFSLLDERARLPPGVIDDDLDAPPPTTKAHAHRGDLQHLFGDRVLMERLVAASSQGIGAHAVAEILEHTRIQFLERTERAFAHVDAERLVASDGRSLDAGTATEDADSVDVEDYAVLFELDRRRALAQVSPTKLRTYDCIVLDEAQELAPIELALIGRCLAPGGTLVVAGDADQQVDPSACFRGWESTMRDLGAEEHETVTLEVGYRCAPATMALARAVRDATTIDRDTTDLPLVHAFDDEPSLLAWIRDELVALEEHDPTATTCVVTRRAPLARRIAAALAGATPRRLVLDGLFVAHRGADVTTVDQLKGLEFDFVIVADATEGEYPDAPASRRALYVALTRARHQAIVAHVARPSPFLPESTPGNRGDDA